MYVGGGCELPTTKCIRVTTHAFMTLLATRDICKQVLVASEYNTMEQILLKVAMKHS